MTRIPIEMRKFGDDMETGRIGTWLKRVGDVVSRGDAIAEVESDQTTVEMEATVSGILVELVHGDGSDVPVGEPIAWLQDD